MSSNDPIIPVICYASCNNAYIAAQQIGRTPKLCASNSTFLGDYTACSTCALQNGYSVSNITSLQIFVDFCAAESAQLEVDASSSTPGVDSKSVPSLVSTSEAVNTDTAALASTNAAQSSRLSLISAALSLATAVSSLEAHLSSLEKSSADHTATVVETEPTGGSQKSYPGPAATKNSSHAWIAAAVIAPVIFIISLVVIAFWIRKRKKAVASPQNSGDQRTKPLEKAQLHGDSVDVEEVKAQIHNESLERHELEGDGFQRSKYELPAVEPVGSELGLGKKETRNKIPRKAILRTLTASLPNYKIAEKGDVDEHFGLLSSDNSLPRQDSPKICHTNF